MDHNIEQQGLSEADRSNHIISFSSFTEEQMNLHDLKPGVQLTQVPEIKDINYLWYLFNNQNPVLRNVNYDSYKKGYKEDLHYNTPASFIQKYLNRNRFHGNHGPITINIMPSENDLTFVSEVPLFSTGRGAIGDLVVMSDLFKVPFVRKEDGETGWHSSYKNVVLVGQDGVDIINSLMEESSASWFNAKK